MAYVGSSVRRSEDDRLLRGIGRFVGDISRAGVLHAAVARSAFAHGRIIRVDVEGARRMAGVVSVITSEDIPGVGPIPMRLAPREDLVRALQRPLASDRVRYVGEPVAVVVARSRYEAEDAVEAVRLEVEPLEAVVDPRRALEPGAPVLHPAVPDNTAGHFVMDVGRVERGLADADEIIEAEFSIQRHSGVPLETRGLVAEFDADSRMLTVWGPTKVVHFNRAVLAELLGLPLSQIRFVEPEVGGGFGIRGEFYPEDFLIPFLAIRLGCPVRWIEDRAEHLKSANHSREQWHRVRVGVKRDGRIVAFDDLLLNNMGGYVRTHGATVPTMTAAYLPGPYKIDNYRCDAHCVLTNKTPAGTYRGPGRFGAAFVRERVMDMVARRLGLDPAEVRLRNFIPREAMPYETGTSAFGTPTIYDSADFAKQFRLALAKLGYEAMREWCAERRREGRAVGIGIACFVEKSGLGPWEYARVEVDPSGQVVVYTGAADVGQGVETVLAQIAADTLAADFAQVRVVHGDTSLVPYGGGSYASRGTVVAGNSVMQAAEGTRAKLVQLAAAALEVSPEDLVVDGGRVAPRGAPSAALSFADLARLATPTWALPRGLQPGTVGEAFFTAEHMVYPYGVHLAVVEVDCETGFLVIHKYLVAYDVGRAINPMLVEGQIVGGVAQGLGGALLEEFAYDDEGQLLTGSFMDYLVPTSAEMPGVEVLLTEDAPSPRNPLGVKGAGEGGTVGVGAALANAVCDALGGVVEIQQLPLTPQRVREAARVAARTRADGVGIDSAHGKPGSRG
jgi:aerobic carbon-monoxide dehydrogenase large subunit